METFGSNTIWNEHINCKILSPKIFYKEYNYPPSKDTSSWTNFSIVYPRMNNFWWHIYVSNNYMLKGARKPCSLAQLTNLPWMPLLWLQTMHNEEKQRGNHLIQLLFYNTHNLYHWHYEQEGKNICLLIFNYLIQLHQQFLSLFKRCWDSDFPL